MATETALVASNRVMDYGHSFILSDVGFDCGEAVRKSHMLQPDLRVMVAMATCFLVTTSCMALTYTFA